jgi:uncharacterized protein (DUF885 family)
VKRCTALLSLTFLCVVYRAEAATSKATKVTPFTADKLQSTAADFYRWREENFPVWSSEQGLHTFDARLTGYSAPALARRRAHIASLLQRVRSADISSWRKDDQIDWILFRAQLERFDFDRRVLHPEETDPGRYVEEAGTAIFSLLKKEYDAPAARARSAMARFRAMPAMFAEARKNLTAPVHLYTQLAIESARAIDPLFTQSVEPLRSALPERERVQFDQARDAAVGSAYDFADWLEKRLPSMPEWKPMGEANYNDMLRNILLLPINAHDLAHLGEVEMVRYRALESLLPDPSLADPDPKRAASIPPDQQSFLAAYQSRLDEMVRFLREKRLVTIPDYVGAFLIRQLPEAFKPTSPGGFMNPPGLYDRDNGGFYFIPTYNPESRNFYIRAAIEDPRPILGHEGIPGHFLQISIANRNGDEIRRHHDDTPFVEGWALYGEEMLLREGLYQPNSASEGQILRLSRYRSARIGVDVNLHTGKWSFEQGVQYFMEGGGLDRESATGEAAGAAVSPTQKISYITGKWQIMRLLGKYRDRKGSAFRLGQFHDDLIANGSLPLSVVEWLILDDPSTLESVVGMKLRHE